jgi:hypothetical protein
MKTHNPQKSGSAYFSWLKHAKGYSDASWWQEHGAAHAGGPRAQQAGDFLKLIASAPSRERGLQGAIKSERINACSGIIPSRRIAR